MFVILAPARLQWGSQWEFLEGDFPSCLNLTLHIQTNLSWLLSFTLVSVLGNACILVMFKTPKNSAISGYKSHPTFIPHASCSRQGATAPSLSITCQQIFGRGMVVLLHKTSMKEGVKLIWFAGKVWEEVEGSTWALKIATHQSSKLILSRKDEFGLCRTI